MPHSPNCSALRWDAGRPGSAKAGEGAHAYDWIAGMFDGSR